MNDQIKHWLTEIDLAKKREKDYRKEGQRILDIYAGKKVKETPFNILFSNTETLLPALYSLVPRPVVQRRFKDEDVVGKNAALAGTRLLEFLLDTNLEGYESFDDSMKAATLDGLLPGRGVTTIKYDADVVEGDFSYKAGELVCANSQEWKRVYFGYAKKWSKVPWVAYELHIDREEADRLFPEMAGKLNYTLNDEDRNKDEDGNQIEVNTGEKKTAVVYQIWDKDGGKKIRYVSPQFKEGFLKEEGDTLNLSGFFNCPKPLQFVEKNDLLPVAMYCLYENQAKELNDMTRRINLIIHAIKAKAIYAGALGDDIKNLVEADDNELVPAVNESALAAEKGLQNAIWFWPVDQLIVVLRELLGAREQCKQVIYEITGISDILRGSTMATETATAQKIKTQWGTLRLKRLQKEVQRYARDMLRMMLEVAAAKFSEETWARMTGLPFVTTEKHQQAKMLAQAAQMAGMPPDPQTMQTLEAPVWGEVLQVLRDDLQRAYRVDIETNSTVEAEATEDKEMMAEVMAAVGQALNGLTPLVTAGTLPFEAAQAMLLTIVRRFRFGPEVEDMIKAMKQPQPPDEAKKQMEGQMQQMKQQADQAIMQATQSATKAQMDLERSNYEKDVIKRESEIALKQLKVDTDERILAMQKQYAERDLQNRSQTESVKLQSQQRVASLENSKFKTENVVNQKNDATLGKAVKSLEGIVAQMAQTSGQLMQIVAQQSQESREQIQELTKAIKAPRVKRGRKEKDGSMTVIEEAA